MIINKDGMRYTYNGTTYTTGAAVVATEESEYQGLCGIITEIRDGVDRETENDTPDIYCCFEPPLFQEEIRELEQRFTELYQSPKKLDEITLDMVIMAPEMVRVISADPKECKACELYLLTTHCTTNLDSSSFTELYADYDAGRFALTSIYDATHQAVKLHLDQMLNLGPFYICTQECCHSRKRSDAGKCLQL